MTLRNDGSSHGLAAIRTRYRLVALVSLMVSQAFHIRITATTRQAFELASFLISFGIRVHQTRRHDVMNEAMALIPNGITMRAFVFLFQFHDVLRVGPGRTAFVIAGIRILAIAYRNNFGLGIFLISVR